MSSMEPTPGRGLIAVLIVALLLPLASTWLYFIVLAGAPGMKFMYGGSKVVQFILPLAWVLLVQRTAVRLTRPQPGPILWGLLMGLGIVTVGLAAYYGYFKTSPALAQAPQFIQHKLDDMGLTAPATYLAFALFLSLPHSLLEEYYWRWFVFGQLRKLLPMWAAIVVSSLGFMAHHVIVLDRFLQGAWGATVLFSLCVAIGGALWAWLYAKTNSLYAPWASHVLVDAGVMYIGYDLVWG